MFRRVLSVLLSASLLAGSVTNTAFAASGDTGYAAAIEAEADESQNPEETNEADLQESTDDSQITDAADENSDVSDADEEAGDQDEITADSEDALDETGGGIINPEDTTDSTDVEESADTTEESEEVDEEEAVKYVTAAPFAVAPMAEGSVDDAVVLSLNVPEDVTLDAAESGESSTTWLKFTADADGDYLFSAVSESGDDNLATHIDFYKGQDNAQSEDSLSEGMDLSGSKNYENGGNPCNEVLTLSQNDEIYLRAKTSEDSVQTFEVKVTKVVEPTDWQKAGDGSYSATVGGRSVTIKPAIGSTSLIFNIATGDKEYARVTYTAEGGGDTVEGEIIKKLKPGQSTFNSVNVPVGERTDYDKGNIIKFSTQYSVELSIEIEKSELLRFSSAEIEEYFTTKPRTTDDSKEALSLDVEKTVVLDGYSTFDNAKWLQFTAAEDGRYQFRFENQGENSDIDVYLFRDAEGKNEIDNHNIWDDMDEKLWAKIVDLKAGETVYVRTTPYFMEEDNECSFKVSVSKKQSPEESAQKLELDQSLTVSLDENHSEEEAKWLKFTAEEEGSYQFGFETIGGSDLWVYLYNDPADEVYIDHKNIHSGAPSWEKTVRLLKNQQVYVKAYPHSGGDSGNFNVKVSRVITLEDSAQVLSLDRLYSISLDDNRYESEAKWLKFTAEERGEYEFWFNTKNGSDINVYLYQDSTEGAPIGDKNVYGSEGDGDNPWSKTVDLKANQQIYIKAYPWSDGTSGQTFDVRVTKKLTPEESAEELTLGSLSNISAGGYEDKWLKFTAAEAGDYLFWFDAKNYSYLNLQLRKDSTEGEYIDGGYIDGYDPWTKTVGLEANQTVYIKAYAYDDYAQFAVKVSKVVEVTDHTPNEDGSYQAAVNGRTITITPNVGYKSVETTVNVSPQTYARVAYVFRDENGEEEYYSDNDYDWGRVIGAQNGRATLKFSGLEMGKKYFLELSLLIDGNEKVIFAGEKNPLEFTTLSIEKDGDDRSIDVSVTPRLNRANLQVTISGKAAVDNDNNVWVFYKKASDQVWTAEEYWLYGTGTETISIYDLVKETEYAYVAGFASGSEDEVTPDNLSKPVTGSFTTLKDDRTITRVDVTPHVNDAKLEITLGGKAAIDNDNLVLIYYKEKAAEQWEKQLCYIESKGTASITTYNGNPLKENTAYEYEIGLAENAETTQENLIASQKGEFNTIKDDKELSVTVDEYLNKAQIKAAISGNAAKGVTNYIYFYFREQGTGEWDSVLNTQRGVGTYSRDIKEYNGEALKQGVTYEYECGFGDGYSTEQSNLTGVQKGTFTIPTDDRKVKVGASDITAKATSASIRATVTGKAAEGITNYVCFFYKEKDSDVWSYPGYNTASVIGSGTTTIDVSGLTAGTTYDYVIGLGDSYYYSNINREELTGTATGTFTTLADTTELTDVNESVGYNSVGLQAFVTGNNTGSSKYVYFFYRVKGDESWTRATYYSSSADPYSPSYTIRNLEQGVSYEYAVVVGTTYSITSPDDVENEKLKKISEFTTKKSAYSLTVTEDQNKRTHNSAVLNVSAAGGQDEKLYVTLNYAIENSDGTVGYVRSKSFNLRQITGYREAVEIDDLGAGATYVVRSADIKVQDNTTSTNPYYWTTIDTITFENVKFTTADAKAPEKITVTPENVTLNLRGDGDGISYKRLKTDITPADAVKDLYWDSDDWGVASVDYWDDYAYIYPQGVGTTKIYARSSYNSEVYGVCEVTVTDYVITNENNETLSSTTLSKGKKLKLNLYDRTGKKNVEDFDVEVYRSSVASWSNGVLTANAVGTTDVVFTAKDGGKAVMNLNVTVAEGSKGFGITGLTSSNSKYPAKGDNGSYKVAKGNHTYTANIEISPSEDEYDNRGNFTWESSDESIATVANGVIRTVKAGSVTITVKPALAEGEDSPYKQDKVEIKLTVQDLPSVSTPTVYALTNLDGTKGKMSLKDVDIVKTLGTGWSWVYPDTPLYSLPTNRQAYAFDAVYSGAEYYPCETKVNVYIGTVTGVSAYEPDEYYDYDTDIDYSFAWHNQVLAVSDGDTTDTLCLGTSIGYNGSISSDVVVSIPSQDGLTIEEKTWRGWDDYDNYIEQQVFLIKATKAGTYDLKPQVVRVERDTSGKITKSELITQTSYKIQAVVNPQVGSIEFTSDDKNITVDDNSIYLDYATDMKNKTFNLTAIVRDRQGNRIDTPLQWKVTDGAVAGVKAGKDTHTAVITVKGDGHAILSVAAKDAAGYTEEVALEFRDHKPRVSTNKASVNLAYDYGTSAGRSLAEQKLGVVEITSVYGERIEYARLYNGDTPATDMSLQRMSGSDSDNSEYIVMPVNQDSLSTGTYQYKLAVKSEANKTPYFYDLKVTVTDKAPKVTAKMQDTVNLFYLNGTGSIKLSVSNDYPVSSYINPITWKQQSTGVNNGFSVSSYAYYNTKSKGYLIGVSQQQIQMNGKNLVDSNIATGTLTVKLNGIRKPIVINNFKMKWNYKKPTLKTEKSTTNVVPETGNMSNYFMIRDSVTKQLLNYDNGDYDVKCNNTNVTLDPYNVWVDYTYSGNNSKENLTLTVESDNWRETLTAKHTIKTAKPKAYLTKTQLTYNLAYKSVDSTYIGLKDAYGGLNLRDVAIEGSNANAKDLLEKDIFEISGSGSSITVKLNKAALMNVTPKKGTYTFKLTPYYTAQDGGRVAMNTLNLKLKVEDKEPTVTISTKGKLDLAQSMNSNLYNNNISLKAAFKNIGSDYKVLSAEVVGEYSDYFTVDRYQYGYWDDYEEFHVYDSTYAPTNNYYLMIKDMNSGYYGEYGTGYGRLKAGQTYKLNIVYTVETASGDRFTVTSAKGFTVKPVQTAPKITVKNNGQTFYAGASSKSRTYTFSVPDNYRIESISGSLDCNKDGTPDIIVTSYNSSYGSTSVSRSVYINDEDAVTASAKGKSYNVPITVRVIGRDGVAKDATTTIKVVVKR